MTPIPPGTLQPTYYLARWFGISPMKIGSFLGSGTTDWIIQLIFPSMSMPIDLKVALKYISFFPKRWNYFLTHSLAGNRDEYRCHRPMWRIWSNINLRHSTSITWTTRFFRPQSYSYTTTLHNSIPGWHCTPFWAYWMENDLFLVF